MIDPNLGTILLCAVVSMVFMAVLYLMEASRHDRTKARLKNLTASGHGVKSSEPTFQNQLVLAPRPKTPARIVSQQIGPRTGDPVGDYLEAITWPIRYDEHPAA